MKNKDTIDAKSIIEILADPNDWPGMVYFVQGAKNSPIKVGFVKDNTDSRLNKRIASLQTGHPEKLEVISVIDPAYEINEKAIHKLLEPWRIRENGEWFQYEAVMSLIDTINYEWNQDYMPIQEQTLSKGMELLVDELGNLHKGDLLCDFMMNQAKTIDRLLTAPKQPILGWLLLQPERDDPVGDLARAAKLNPNMFLEIRNLIEYSETLPYYMWYALISAYNECLIDIKELGTCLLPDKPLPWEKCMRQYKIP